MRRGETDGQISFNHHNEGIHMSEQNTHTTNDTVDPQFLGPEAGQQAGGGKPCEGNSMPTLDENVQNFMASPLDFKHSGSGGGRRMSSAWGCSYIRSFFAM